jgi:hypothetical protein
LTKINIAGVRMEGEEDVIMQGKERRMLEKKRSSRGY